VCWYWLCCQLWCLADACANCHAPAKTAWPIPAPSRLKCWTLFRLYKATRQRNVNPIVSHQPTNKHSKQPSHAAKPARFWWRSSSLPPAQDWFGACTKVRKPSSMAPYLPVIWVKPWCTSSSWRVPLQYWAKPMVTCCAQPERQSV